ncbi:MAG TPA: dTDP-4-dehydrorhamnose reductase [Leptolyngbyaceae cyanobacterium M33_DOE_097]|uniref:dTDP-4-dehydrorhamnose reductase n=1 Tax=Oscillatoriales cyanobacterium SpSt-418 TaxID=2282169 RepID=A0A7C3PEW2_9CYAN|nr:dTDP-4-dehydrorhamnose reductase [Leptolyngbyaceae cyanobacterium M33_DOE_097]
MTKILLIGANGQVGRELQQTLLPLGEVIAVARDQLDLANPEAAYALVVETAPNVIVNAAAYTAVDKAESEPDLAMAVNGTTPEMMAKAASSIGAGLIHISTDYVFDGTQGVAYQETGSTNPKGVYGRTKLAGEEAIQAALPMHMIIRTAWVYGALGKANFVKTMLRLGADRSELRVVGDQIGSPTWAKDLALAIAQMIPKFTPETAGLYHYTNSGVASWYDFAVAIFEEAEALGFPLKIEQVVPITTAEYPTPAQRPAFSVLSLKKTASLLGHCPPHWRASLRKMLVELQTGEG